MNTHTNIQYLKKNFDEIGIMAVLAKVALGNLTKPTLDDELVMQALRRSKTSLEGSSLEEIGEYLSSMNDNSISGIVNNVKGILHEIEYVAMENSDGDTVMAGIFEHTNHKDYDVWKYDSSTGEYSIEQLKTTEDASAVRDWMESHPDETIVVDEELAEKLGIESSGLNNDELEYRVEDIVDKLKDLSEDDSIWNYFPTLTTLSISIIVFSLYKRFKNGEITAEEFKFMAIRTTGLKLAKISMLLVMLSIPVISVITGLTLTYNLIKSGQQILDS